MSAVAIVAIVFGSIVVIVRTIFHRPRHGHGDAEERADYAQLAVLAERLNKRIESLEQLLDATQPDWRGKP